jgi:hypothetical protein
MVISCNTLPETCHAAVHGDTLAPDNKALIRAQPSWQQNDQARVAPRHWAAAPFGLFSAIS